MVEEGANIQDCRLLHGFPGKDTVVGAEATVGHGAVLHGCARRRGALVGMNAVVNDNAEVGEEAMVAALAFVKAEDKIPPRSLVAGIPARVLRALTEQELRWKKDNMLLYQDLARRSAASMREAEALTAVEPSASASTSPGRCPPFRAQGSQPMTYQLILMEKKGRVALITLNRPKQLNALSPSSWRSSVRRCAPTPTKAVGAIAITGNDKAFAAGADIAAMKDYSYMDAFKGDYITAWEHFPRRAQARHRGGRRLCARRRLRARHAVRHPDRRRQREVRPARDEPGHHARLRRHPAPAALHEQGEGHGPVPHRAHDGRPGGGARRPGFADCLTGQADGGGARGRRRKSPATRHRS